MIQWRFVTEESPADGDLPVTVVRSTTRDRAVWSRLIPDIDTNENAKVSVSPYFENGEIVAAEEWYPKPS